MKLQTYPASTRNEAKHLFVEKEMTFKAICAYFGGKPAHQTISNWSHAKDKQQKTWFDYREERSEQRYLQMSPQNMASKILEKIWLLMNDSTVDVSKLGDALSKYQKSLDKLTNIEYQIPVMYHMLQDYVLYCKSNHTDLVDEDFLESVRAYKNHIRARLEHDYS